MKKIKKVVIYTMCMCFLFGAASCAVFVTRDDGRNSIVKKDNGLHKGWYKNPKNPHNSENTYVAPTKEKKKK